ncbi:SWIM zinc finger family protein [Hymenobacter terricola]|uniref:SWIM zinc finger family protein n=1 Tax=Hymenobacter terricola TaxID=2819236 RepID=UPI001B317C5A|nr:hypothetical protein [Hymenobacter terricola]
MFTRQTLRHLANASSFERGEDYYDEGNVTRLRREEDTFRATVRGSRGYRVALRLAAAGPEFECNCPYEFGGICKHEVALGLAVLDAYGTNLAPATPAKPAAASELAAAVQAAWANRKKGDKLRFLKQALAKSDDLARQFLGFGRQPPAVSGEALLASLPTRLAETLEVLEFDEEFYENSESYYEEDEGDGLAEAVEAALREALAPFVAELLALARGGQLTDALRYWTTASAAIYQIEEPASDDYGSFGHYGTDVLRQWHADLTAAGWPAGLLAAVLPPAELKAALNWLGQYLANPPARWPDFEASWQPLVLALAADPTAVDLLPTALKKADFTPDTLARLALQSAQTRPNDAAWAEAAESLLPTDAAVAQQLLNFYATRAERPALLRAATTAFTTWPDQFGNFVLATFTAAQAPDLYRAALRHRTLANASLEDFERLRPLLTPAALAAFVQAAVAAAQARRGSVAFAAELLVRTADTAALQDFVLGLEWLAISPPYHTEMALLRLAAQAPTPLMLELETRTRAYLNGRANAKRGHFLYERIGRWLATVRGEAPRLTEPVLRLALELRQEFPTLHGLRDALRAEGLLPGEPATPKKAPGRRGR